MIVLVADDNVDARMALGLLLESRGHEVRFASDGGEAMAVMGEQRPDLVILDLFMPRVNGWEFLDSKGASAWADVPVVVLSGWSQMSQPLPASAGVIGVIEKGGDPAAMLDRIDEFLKQPKPES